MNFNEYEKLVIEWAKARCIIPNATSTAQLLKAVSEMGELADAVNKLDRYGIKDAVGDVVVCLINFCELEGITVTECLAIAYDQIKDRKGTLLPNGVFVKEDK
jgi:uncharacterized protein YabN with tetrapyrrole methylase and pyrophosphatase domain